MDAEIKDLVDRFAADFPEDSSDRLGDRVTLAILGRDALIGTLGSSLHAFLEKQEGMPLFGARFDPVPTHTGVPFIDREARFDTDVAGVSVAEGHEVRCQLQSFSEEPARHRGRFFGAGAHLCLGKPVSLDLFREISDHLHQLATRAKVLDFALRKDDVFNIPDTFEVEVSK